MTSTDDSVIQRAIQGIYPNFTVAGRLTGHDSHGNNYALSEKIRIIGGQGNPRSGMLNAHEEMLRQNAGLDQRDFISGNLRQQNFAICHKMSDQEVQQRVAEAGNNPTPQQFNAIIHPMLTAIAVPGWAPVDGAFQQKALSSFNNANDIAAQQSVLNNRQAPCLTRLAKRIANSPVNLFIGSQPTNASISNRGDFNTRELQGTLRRPLTLDSVQVYQALWPTRHLQE